MDGELISELMNKYYNQLTTTDKKMLKMYATTLKDIKKQLLEHSEKLLQLESTDIFKADRLVNVEKQIELLIYELFNDLTELTEETLVNQAINFDKEFVSILEDTFPSSSSFTTLNKGVIKELVKENWLGMDFYERFGHKAYNLTYECKNILRTGLMQGKSFANMIKEMEVKTGKYYKESETLVRSEGMHVLNSAMVKQYEDLGVTSVEHYTALDERVCKVCGKAHGKKYRIGKQPNLPLHPKCRCTYLEALGSIENALKKLGE